MSSLEALARGRQRLTKEKPPEQIEREKALNRARVARSRQKAAARAALFVPGESCSVVIKLDAADSKALDEGMRWRALWATAPYDLDEYIQTLIVRDRERLAGLLAELPPCKKCGARLPDSCARLHYGEADCRLTTTRRELAL